MSVLYGRLADLVSAAHVALINAGRPEPARVGVYNGGDVAADECCNGQLYARWLRSMPNLAGAAGGEGCAVMYVADLAVGVLRCAPVAQGKALAPTMAKIDDSAQGLHDDAEALLQGVAAWGADLIDDEWSVIDVSPLGPDGDCLGVEVRVRMGYDPRCCPA